jgi:hypothetical protein
MAKQLAALIQERKTEHGTRVYGVYDRQGTRIAEREVIDCGQGAHVATEWAKKLYTVSNAEWVYKLARQVAR